MPKKVPKRKRQNVLTSDTSEQTERTVHSTTNSIGRTKRKKTTGAIYMPEILKLPTGTRLSVDCNEFGQPIDDNRSKFACFLGVVARTHTYAPIDILDWRKMPKSKKQSMLELLQEKFNCPPGMDEWILQSIGIKWRNWKADLKYDYFDPALPLEDLVKERDERVDEQQWRRLIMYWLSDKGKGASIRGQQSRKHKILHHKTGRRPFAQVLQNQAKKGKHQIYKDTPQKKNKKVISSSSTNSDEVGHDDFMSESDQNDHFDGGNIEAELTPNSSGLDVPTDTSRSEIQVPKSVEFPVLDPTHVVVSSTPSITVDAGLNTWKPIYSQTTPTVTPISLNMGTTYPIAGTRDVPTSSRPSETLQATPLKTWTEILDSFVSNTDDKLSPNRIVELRLILASIENKHSLELFKDGFDWLKDIVEEVLRLSLSSSRSTFYRGFEERIPILRQCFEDNLAAIIAYEEIQARVPVLADELSSGNGIQNSAVTRLDMLKVRRNAIVEKIEALQAELSDVEDQIVFVTAREAELETLQSQEADLAEQATLARQNMDRLTKFVREFFDRFKLDFME